MKSKNIIIENLTKSFERHDHSGVFTAVNNISVTIDAGEFVTLLGPSGCGKTTTLRMIAGFEDPTSGSIYLGGEKINNLPPNKRDTAMVFQSYALFPHYNIYENIAYGLKIHKMPNDQIAKKVGKIIELVGLTGLEKRNPSQLSGGQQQRVALARALVMEPSVLLFDEPLSNLDAKLRVYMRNEIKRIQRQLGLTSVYVTHDQSEAMSLSDKVIIMNQGHIEQIGSPQTIYQRPATEFIADFIGAANFIDGEILEVLPDHYLVRAEGREVRVNKFIDEQANIDATQKDQGQKDHSYRGGEDFSKGDEVRLVVRPEAIEVATTGKFTAKVLTSTFMGNVQEYILQMGKTELFVETPNPSGKKTYSEGETVALNIEETGIHLIKK